MPINNKRKRFDRGMAKDYEDYRRRNERTQEAVRRRRNADYATRRSADIMRMKITASRSDELVRLVRQKDQVPMQSADKLRDRATQQTAADVICALLVQQVDVIRNAAIRSAVFYYAFYWSLLYVSAAYLFIW